jgi:hypothetical protein
MKTAAAAERQDGSEAGRQEGTAEGLMAEGVMADGDGFDGMDW